jgi:hypothetical protein
MAEMNRTVQGSDTRPVRKSLIWIILLAAAGIVGAAWIYRGSRHAPSPQGEVAAQPAELSAAQNGAEDSELRPLTAEEIANAARPPSVIQSTSRGTADALPAPARIQPTPETQQLVTGLAQLDFSGGAVSPEQVDQWKKGLQALVQQGGAAIPAIREFLEKNVDLDYTAANGPQLLGYSSLRSAFLDALQQIGGPEATDVMLQTLRTTGVPSEIARLADYLEQQAPGQYRQQTISAVTELLAIAAKGKLAGWDMGPLFPVLAKYGDPAAVQQVQSQWKYYATMSLAGLEGGAGVPALIRQVQAPAGSKNDFAFQMLAQQASGSPDATAALMEQAHNNQIPDSAWREIAMGLAGDQYFMGTQWDTPPAPGTVPGLKTYHIEAGNQNFYSLPLSSTGGDSHMEQRLSVIDQLLAATSSAAGRQALQQARATLTGSTAAK